MKDGARSSEGRGSGARARAGKVRRKAVVAALGVLLPTAVLITLARQYGGSVRASLVLHVMNNAVAYALASAVLLRR